jgi:heme O synthase-like polyprenyltransferase
MKVKNIFQYTLGALIVIGFFVLLYLLLSYTVPDQNKDILNLVIGALIGSFTTIVGYFYGSSLGSADKNDLLSKKSETI